MTLAFSVCVALLMFLCCGALIEYAQHAAERNAATILRATERQVQEDLADDEHPVALSDLVDEEREALRPNGMALLVVDSNGRILEKSQPDTSVYPNPNPSVWRTTTLKVHAETVVLGLPWGKTQRGLRSQAVLLLILGLFITAISTLGAWILVGHTLAPIDALARQAQTASAENLTLRLSPPSQDAEILRLVSTLNGLLQRTAQTVSAKGRFHAAASHELRTPLQALSGHLELALDRPRTSEEYRAFVEEANTHAQRLTALTRDLLLLHQLDSAQPSQKCPVNLSEICDRLLRLIAPAISQRSLRIRSQLLCEGILETVPTHAEMLVRNLLENAVKYCDKDGEIALKLCDADGRLRLSIYNECAPLHKTDIERLFEPFYRPDSSRDSNTGGSGLGLAICSAITAANGWTVSLEQQTHGMTATVVF